MSQTSGRVPNLPKEITERWMHENQYPCGAFKKCEKCSPAVYSTCATWEIWFKKVWNCICSSAEALNRKEF